MGLNVKKLENVEYHGSRTIARCPACAEQGHDNKGEHLSIDEQGRFSCVVYPGNTGTVHRKRIFALVGINNGNSNSYSKPQNKMIKVKKVNRNHGTVIKTNVLGRLGRVTQTLKKQNENDTKERIYNKEYEKGVPSVPKTEDDIRTSNRNAADIEEQVVEPTVEKSCTCGRRATTFDFGEIENGKFDWTFYCNSCNPHKEIDVESVLEQRANHAPYNEITERTNSGNVEPVVTKTCAKCGKPEERFCYGEVAVDKYKYDYFCLECYPHHF